MLLLPWLASPLLLCLVRIVNAASLPTGIPSFIMPDTTVSAISDAECERLDGCRSLYSIVQSCIVTILACVWFAVHRNVPAPKSERPHHDNLFVRATLSFWHRALDQRQAAIVFVVALLAPEWVLAWALRQFLVARGLAKKLEAARAEANEARNKRISGSTEAETDPGEIGADALDEAIRGISSAISFSTEHDRLIVRHLCRPEDAVALRTCDKRCENCGLDCSSVIRSEYDPLVVAKRVAKADEIWGMPHAFFVIMGGYHFYNEAGPRHPLSPHDVVELVRRGRLVPPAAEELANQSKGDALSKGVAIVQTLWFVLQCLARLAAGLPVTSLEVMTLAYTVITVAICAVRVPEEKLEEAAVVKYHLVRERIAAYVMGWQDFYVDLRECTRVPTFWAGQPLENDYARADTVALFVAMVFGAVHCIAWSHSFQSQLEQQLWRAFAVAIIAVPVAFAVVSGLTVLIAQVIFRSNMLVEFILLMSCVPLALVYIAARLLLIVMSFTSLRMLPVTAYQTVRWTNFVPHI
ncbi:hypothetical protein HWV62_40136 [Athelia sp. TMB]|nr:hypothetical protein HWV62_40136 [Athelia sp. TMB]